MKKLISVVSVFSVMLLIACGGSSSSTDSNTVQVEHDPALVGMWGVTSIDGEAVAFQIGVEFMANGAYATKDYATVGGCDSSGTWETDNGVLITIIKAVSPEGPTCDRSVGGVERNNYTIDADVLTLVSLPEGSVMTLRKM